ncbi:MAG: hypothetical protein HOP19_13595 [Acidobacteria bacterium]|nr:hypothetical protein [Acidobacteriota bacterium]
MHDDDNDEKENRELKPQLVQWATVEPQRCRQTDANHFEILYAGQWLKVTDQPPSHGLILAATLEACWSRQIYFRVEYFPSYEDDPAEIRVGCIYKTFRYTNEEEGREFIGMIPALLLLEYLERLQDTDSN